jgi:2-polyprenyl-3-methyl-5-hydroxy-6-metoxy-1,4-benzoquinol methylase
MDTIRADFDRIALLPDDGWDHNHHYHDYLLRQLPARCSFALDIGCGTGAFARQLAERADHVLAIDLSPRMIEIARERSANHPNIAYQVADILEWELPRQHFDCIASIATLHHLPMAALLPRVRGALSEQGVLLVLDLFQARTVVDFLVSALAVPANVFGRLAHSGRLSVPREVKEAWAEHGRHDRYLTLRDVRRLCAEHLPGAVVRRHLFWRYSLVWRGGVGIKVLAPLSLPGPPRQSPPTRPAPPRR